MKKQKSHSIVNLLFLIFLLIIPADGLIAYPQEAQTAEPEKVYYAIEINGTLCGYTEATESRVHKEGQDLLQNDLNMFIMLSLLGSEFNTEIKIKSLLDVQTRRANMIDVRIDQGTIHRAFTVNVEDDLALFKSEGSAAEKRLRLSPDVLVGTDEALARIKKDFYEKNVQEVSYDILEAIEEAVHNSTFKRVGEEDIELNGKMYHALIIEQINNVNGVRIKYWIAPEADNFLKFEVMNRKIYLTDHKVVDRIKVANMNESIFTKSNVSIIDVQAITYMKLKVEIEPVGVILSAEDLNIPGQTFTGSISENLIEGIMEIAYDKYEGANAPPFPYAYEATGGLKDYLKPEKMIQSDDPVLIAKANEITRGSKDGWEAATRLSRWVAENIAYAIPGGGEARKTYDIRAGECGAHSMLLAAFCRAVGIPARVVWGGMYVPNYGGGFGQHGWNEIYMGEAGWIPVDATAFETDFVDAGHIRIAEMKNMTNAFNARKIEVLEYRLREGEAATAVNKDLYLPYLGKYSNLASNRVFEVIEKEGNLAVVIPGQAILPLKNEDENGKWNCKIAPQLYVEFDRDSSGTAKKMILHEIVSMQKKAPADSVPESVSMTLVPYLGTYYFPAVNAEFTVLYADNNLAIYDPLRKDTVGLQPPDQNGRWLDEYNKNTVFFEKDGVDNVIALKIDSGNEFLRGELASYIFEREMEANGLDSAVRKYNELKGSEDKAVIFTEKCLNSLGYKLLRSEKLNEAIAVFKLNVEAYPESFNVHDSMGEAYLKSGQKELAIVSYKKSLELNPNNENASHKLAELGLE